MSTNYANANEVLPGELLGVLQRHPTGMLYIPTGKTKSMKNLVIGMLGQGASSREIEAVTGLTRRRINQIRAGYNASEGPHHAK